MTKGANNKVELDSAQQPRPQQRAGNNVTVNEKKPPFAAFLAAFLCKYLSDFQKQHRAS
jgi:hypothetical protein